MNYTAAIWLSIKCGILSAVLLLPWSIFWGWILARKRFPGRGVLETVLLVPMVLPPVLSGYGLLLIIGPAAPLGQWLQNAFGIRFVLDWKGAVLASAVVASPFGVQLCRQAFLTVDRRLEWAAQTLGANRRRVWRTIILPLAWPGIAAGILLTFTRSVGEFGATIILAGNIPEKTQTIPLAIYSAIYQGSDTVLWPLVLAAVVLAYAGLAMSQWVRGADPARG